MATFYVDLVNGNDASAGTSFATRKKTIASALSSAAMNDSIRVMASPAATSTGINATWTSGSAVVTLASALTATIDNCETAWTASANVTATAVTTPLRQGTYAASLNIAAAFTTGLVAYKALGSAQNFSGYQQISLLVRSNSALAAGVLTLSLCSDTAGATPVNTISLPAISSGYWTKVTVDTGAALGSSIQSVALSATSDPGTITVYLDNIIACKASSAADCITHRSLISKNNGTDPWMAIESINGTTITLAGQTADVAGLNANIAGKYWGATETVTLHEREPITLSAVQSLTRGSGYLDPSANSIVISGGWNTTDMSTKVDRTYFRQADPSAHGFSMSAPYVRLQSFVASDCLSFATFNYTDVPNVSDCAASGTFYGINMTATGNANLSLVWAVGVRHVYYNSGASGDDSSGSYFYASQAWGLASLNTEQSWFFTPAPATYMRPTVECPEVRNFGSAVLANGPAILTLKNCSFIGCGRDLQIYNDLYAYNCTFNDNTLASGIQALGGATLFATRLGNDSNQHGQCNTFGRIVTATDQRRTASDVSWKFTSTSALLSMGTNQLSLNVASLACPANEARTVSLWFRRDNAASAMRLRVKGGFTPGVANDVVANMTAAANTWEQLSVTFTPTANAVVQVFAEFAGANTTNGWVDDLGVT